METFKIGICEPEDFSKRAISKLETIGSVSLFDGSDLRSFISDKNAIFIRLKYLIDDNLISNAQYLQYICSPTTGLNHIRISSHNNIDIVSLKGEYEFLDTIRATPEHIFGLTLSLLRNYSHAFLCQSNDKFDRNLYRGYELYQNSVGIIGMGRVGKILAKYFSAFDSDVYYYDIVKKKCVYARECASLNELIDKASIIILCANYLPQNEKMINKTHFRMMKGKYFINAARGELINEMELVDFLEDDWFKGVAVDVLTNETEESAFLKKVLALTDKNNLIITPHIGGATYTSMKRTEEFIAEKLIANYKVEGVK